MEKKQVKKTYKLLSEREDKFSPDASPEEIIEDLRKLQKDNEDKFISRNFYRANGSFSEATWTRFFGTFHEFRRQAGLEFSRQQHGLEKQIAKRASVDHYHNFFSTQVLPYHLKYEKDISGDIVSILVCSDLHDLEVDRFALSIFLDQCRLIQPDIIIFNGDIYDCYEFSHFSKDARKCKPIERLKFVREHVWKTVRELCPKAQIDFIIGNHEYRLLRLFADANPYLKVILSDFVGLKLADIFGIDEFQINLQSKIDLGCYSPSDIEKELQQNYKVYFDCYVASHKPSKHFNLSGTNGHHHKGEIKTFTNLINGKPINQSWAQSPALHSIDAEYIDSLSQANLGFLEVHLSKSTKEVIQKLHLIQPKWGHINGKIYKA